MATTEPKAIRKKGTGNIRRFSNGVWQASFSYKGGRNFIEAASRQDAESKLDVALEYSKTDLFDGTRDSLHQHLVQQGFPGGIRRAVLPLISSYNINQNTKTSWRVSLNIQGQNFRIGATSKEEARAKFEAFEKAVLAGQFQHSNESIDEILKAAGFATGRKHSEPNLNRKKTKHGPFKNGIRLRVEGYFEGRCYYSQTPISVYAPTKKEAEKKLRAIQASINNGSFVGKNEETLAGYLMWWAKFAGRTTLRPSTQTKYLGYIANHFIPYFDDLKLQSLTTEKIQNFFDLKRISGRADGKEGGVAHKTLTDIKNMLTKALNYAVNPRKLIQSNPAYSVILKFRQPKPVPTMESEEMEMLIEQAMASDQPIAWAIVILLRTGMRRGELIGLQLSRITDNESHIRIDQALCRLYHPNKEQMIDNEYRRIDTWADKSCKTGLYLGPPKTASSVREFPVGKQVTECIQRLIAYQEKLLGHSLRKNSGDAFLIVSPKLRPYDPATLEAHFKQFLEKSGVFNISVHSTRHSFTTDMLRKFPEELPTISEIVGHASKSTTLRYSHGAQSKKKRLWIASKNKMLSSSLCKLPGCWRVVQRGRQRNHQPKEKRDNKKERTPS